jgi:hypothetical protein
VANFQEIFGSLSATRALREALFKPAPRMRERI